jgi:hypothetical protein
MTCSVSSESGRAGGGERAGVLELSGEDREPLGLPQGEVVRLHPPLLQELGDGGLVAAAVLAEVERGEVEAEGLGAGAESGEPPGPGEGAEAGGREPLGEEGEVLAEPLGGVRGPPSEVSSDAGAHGRHLHAEGLVAVREDLGLGEEALGEVGLDGGAEGLGGGAVAVGDREVLPEPTEVSGVQSEGGAAVLPEGLARDLRGDAGVAVAVPADPRAEPDGPGGGGLRGEVEVRGGGTLEVVGDPGERGPDGVRDEVEHEPDLLADARAVGADLVGGQEKGNLLVEPLAETLGLGGGEALVLEGREQRGSLGLFVEDGAAAGLGGVGREGGLDVEPGEPPPDGLRREALPAEPVERLGDGLGAGDVCRGRGGALAVDPGDLELLGLVDEVEERGHRGEEPADLLGRERGDLASGRVEGGVVALGPRLLREPAEALEPVRSLGPRQRRQRPPDERADEVHLTSEGSREAVSGRADDEGFRSRCHGGEG